MMMVEAGKAIVGCSGENKRSGGTTALLIGVRPPHGCQIEGL